MCVSGDFFEFSAFFLQRTLAENFNGLGVDFLMDIGSFNDGKYVRMFKIVAHDAIF